MIAPTIEDRRAAARNLIRVFLELVIGHAGAHTTGFTAEAEPP